MHHQKLRSLTPTCSHLPTLSCLHRLVLSFNISHTWNWTICDFVHLRLLLLVFHYSETESTLSFLRMNSTQWCRYAVWALACFQYGVVINMYTQELWCGYVFMLLEETDSLDDISIFLTYKENAKVFSTVTVPLYILLRHALWTEVFLILKPHLSFDCRHSMKYVLNFPNKQYCWASFSCAVFTCVPSLIKYPLKCSGLYFYYWALTVFSIFHI